MQSILLIHSHYGSSAPSGENAVFEAERSLLQRAGHTVHSAERHGDTLRRRGAVGALVGGMSTPWNPHAARSVARLVAEKKPDIVHVHNTFPMFSPAVFPAVSRRAATVLTLHNYRLLCPAAIPMRNGEVCTSCIDRRSALPSVVHGCYRGSRLATAPVALLVALHRWLRTWRHHVHAFVALTQFQADLMAEGGLPRERIHVKPNFFPGEPTPVAWQARERRVVFVGRLSAEKGVLDLVSAWEQWGADAPKLLIVGDGPLRAEVESRVQDSGLGDTVELRGQVQAEEAQRLIADSQLLVLPSRWFEGFPMTLREALAFGTPAVVSDLGPLPELIGHDQCGAVFASGDPTSLGSAVKRLWHDEATLRQQSRVAFDTFRAHYTERENYQQLLDIYEHAKAAARGR